MQVLSPPPTHALADGLNPESRAIARSSPRFPMDFKPIKLPPELEETCLAKFDDLVSREEIFYSVSTPEIVEHKGFKVRLNDMCSCRFQFDLEIVVRVPHQPCAVEKEDPST